MLLSTALYAVDEKSMKSIVEVMTNLIFSETCF